MYHYLFLLLFSCSVVSDSLKPHGLQHARLPCLPLPSPQSLLKLMSIESLRPSNLLILCHLLLLLPSIFPSINVFSNESALRIRWPYIGTLASTSPLPMNIQSSFPLRLTDLISLLPKGLSRLLQHHSSKASVLQFSAFFMAQLSHPYMTTEKTIALIIRTCISKVMSLLFNMLSRFVIAFFPRSKRLLVSWLQSPSTVILEPRKTNSVTAGYQE